MAKNVEQAVLVLLSVGNWQEEEEEERDAEVGRELGAVLSLGGEDT